MPLALTDDHRLLAETAADLLARRQSRGAARALLDAPDEHLPPFWDELAGLGWLGLHLPEEHGGSGFGIEELVVLVEQLGRAIAPGPFVPTVIAGAVLSAAGDEDVVPVVRELAEGSRTAAIGFGGRVTLREGRASGVVEAALGAGIADLLLVPAGPDVLLLRTDADGVVLDRLPNLDPTRRSARVVLSDASATVLPGAAALLRDITRIVLSAEAVGIAHECTRLAADYATVRQQFGRPIGTFQAVKHHCADMIVAAELATAAVWDAARATRAGVDERALAAAVAATLAGPAADLCAGLDIQVHGGIGFTWEHDAHLYYRRAVVLHGLLDGAGPDATELTRAGVRRSIDLDLPPEAETFREQVRAFATQVEGTHGSALREALIDSGYVVPHWPRPWGRDAGAVEQLVIEQEFAAAGIERPAFSITGWVILTLIQHATPEQVDRWVRSALTGEVIWCQLFSEPGAGSDAAGITTRGVRVEGGWRVTGQKVWTSGAHVAGWGLATVRTDPTVPKHKGITTMVIDMHAPGVDVRPLRQMNGGSEFNEVFLDDVFVPDADVVGAVHNGWKVARATLGNESVSLGGGQGGQLVLSGEDVVASFDRHDRKLPGGAQRIGEYVARQRAAVLLNLRSAHRAVAGGGPGPEGFVSKLVYSELARTATELQQAMIGPSVALLDDDTRLAFLEILWHRGMSIAGGTSEIKRNQIGERILGLPRDPLIS
ncbi:acyl-CoA dehydrogenase [Pseudonocardia ailaonensis]|uniref:Acyl-CoA dehydrogenase n=1 Tax=Pseudonocardia ailaonensis TaxID=367279 RepID=A0ABN2MY76_9PSEU